MDSPKEELLRQKTAAWENFLHSGSIEPDRVGPIIAESWLKCVHTGLDPADGKGRTVLEKHRLRELWKRTRSSSVRRLR